MAKQSGLHQIRGKVGEHSYYSQTGVIGGLIRQINQGMSEKVKTAAAFANTRLNNAEFGQAGRIASALAKFIEPKYRPMILPFSQSKMAKQILEVIKQDSTGSWGRRNINDPAGEAMAPILSSVAKNDFGEWGISFGNPVALGSDVTLQFSSQFGSKLVAIGASDALVKVVFANSLIGKFNSSDNSYTKSYARGIIKINQAFDTEGEEDIPVSWPSEQDPASVWQNNHLVVVMVFPRRRINGVDFILQEHCTFRAFEQATVQTLP